MGNYYCKQYPSREKYPRSDREKGHMRDVYGKVIPCSCDRIPDYGHYDLVGNDWIWQPYTPNNIKPLLTISQKKKSSRKLLFNL